MKITNKKMFIRGILLLLLAVGIGISRFCIFTEATHGIPKAVIGIGICLLGPALGIGCLRQLLSG